MFGFGEKRARKGSVERKSAPAPVVSTLSNPEPWLLDLFGASPVSSGVSVTPANATSCPAVRCAVAAISEAIGQLPIHVYGRILREELDQLVTDLDRREIAAVRVVRDRQGLQLVGAHVLFAATNERDVSFALDCGFRLCLVGRAGAVQTCLDLVEPAGAISAGSVSSPLSSMAANSSAR